VTAARTWPSQPAGRIALLDVDPDLGAGMRDGAAGRLTVPVYRVATGPLPQPPATDPRDRIGFLVLKGLLIYEVTVCGRATAELLGPGDVVMPWTRELSGTLTIDTKWTVLEQALLADLSPLRGSAQNGFDIVQSLMMRCAEHAESVSVQRSIAAHVRVDVRVLAYLWHLADRFGVVIPGGIRLNLPLTHAVLARLVGARRPTVTTALQRLMQLGYLHRENRAFVLMGDAGAIDELEARSPAHDFATASSDGKMDGSMDGKLDGKMVAGVDGKMDGSADGYVPSVVRSG